VIFAAFPNTVPFSGALSSSTLRAIAVRDVEHGKNQMRVAHMMNRAKATIDHLAAALRRFTTDAPTAAHSTRVVPHAHRGTTHCLRATASSMENLRARSAWNGERRCESLAATSDADRGIEVELLLKENDTLRYLLRRPIARREHAPALLCFLHGSDEAAPCETLRALTRHGPLRGSARAGEGFVIVAPQLPSRAQGWLLCAEAIQDIVLHELVQHACDPTRVYLTGFSIGANGVFDLARIQPELWRALWVVDPARVPEDDISTPVWLSVGNLARRDASTFIRHLRLQPVSELSDRVWEDIGSDHADTAQHAYSDERVYQWLLQRSV
jgi:predicted esterase